MLGTKYLDVDTVTNVHESTKLTIGTPKLRFSESRFSEKKPAPLIFYTIHSLGLVNRK